MYIHCNTYVCSNTYVRWNRCDGIANSGKSNDKCGVCGGTDACIDCRGVAFGGFEKDVCGVCGGNGQT